MAIEIVDFPINSMVMFHSKLLVHQRVLSMVYGILYHGNMGIWEYGNMGMVIYLRIEDTNEYQDIAR